VVAAEALLRWRSPSLGSVPPATFIPVAEETGLMAPIGRWVLREACVQLSRWIEEGLPPIRMAVNVSLCQFQRGDFAELVGEALRETGLPPGLLELELSERGALRGEPEVLRQLERLKALGVRLLADDFGTGQSAIGYLKQFPLDGLKIDRSFVRGVADSTNDAAIVSAIIAMAHRLSLGVVAEGVETQRQLEVLREYRCEEVQGFLFSVPLPAPEFRQWWRDRLGPAWAPWPESAREAAAQPMTAANRLH
jgi:EAL domain-containing protein (putative c-di-GMP-specific phosphodiesterase class I)